MNGKIFPTGSHAAKKPRPGEIDFIGETIHFMIKTHDLQHHYAGQHKGQMALNGLNLNIPAGQMYGLIGPDGAGKTTAIRILSTVINPSHGEASIAGFSTHKQAEKIRRLIGYMPQNFSLYPDLSVLENLNFFADANAVSKAQKAERIPKMLAFTRLEAFTARRAGNLSGGMKKKLALACALIHDPQVLLLDEPSTGVDPVSRREFWLILSQVVANGVTVLVSTPYMDEAERCHQVGILYQGKILVDGTPKDLTSNLPFEIVEVKAKPRKLMRQVVQDDERILKWRPIGDRLRLCVQDPAASMTSLKQNLEDSSAEIKLLRRSKRTMEDVFIHLVEKQREQK
jgi:ABC-2 type transport system ATP-binding protein